MSVCRPHPPSSIVGYQSITINPGFNLISLNFEPIDGTPVDIQDLIQNKEALVAGNGAAVADQIQIWDGTKFTIYYYRAYKSNNPGKFTLGPCWVDGNNASVKATVPVTRGMGVWFARPESSAAGEITLTGSVGKETKNLQINPGFNMIGSAFPCDVSVNSDSCPIDWTTCAIAGNGAAVADQIQIWDGAKFTVYYYRAYKSNNPGKFTLGPCWVDGNNASVKADLTIKSGTGFWYARPDSESAGTLPQKSPIAPVVE